MSSRSLVLVAVIVIVLGGGGAWLMFGSSGTAPADEGELVLMPSDGMETHAKEPDRSVLTAPKPAVVDREDAPVAAERSEAPGPERVSHTGSIWVEGRLAFPADTPPDEIVTVIARGKEFKGKEDDPKEYRGAVEPNGKFRVAFAKGTTRGRLAIEAKYLYLEKSLRLRTKALPDELLLEPKLGGCVDVTVIPPSQAPFSDEELEAIDLSAYHHQNNRAIIPRKAVHVEGPLFRLGGLEGAPDYLINLDSNLFMNKNDSGVGVKPGELTEVEFQIEPGVRISGRTVDSQGEPVAGVQLQFQADNMWESVTSDEEGKFDQGGLSDGDVKISASKLGYETGTKDMNDMVKGDAFTDVEIVLESGNSLVGIVTWPDGSPAPEAKIVVKQKRGENEMMWAPDEKSYKGESDGTFEITGLNANSCTISVRAQPEPERIEGESASKFKRRKRKEPYWHARMEDVSPGAGKLTFVLAPGAGVRGTVVDDLGQPLDKFKVIASPVGDNPWSRGNTGRVSASVRDSEDGSFVLEGLKEGAFEIYATAADHSSVSREGIEIPHHGDPIKIVLPRSSSVAGVVHDVEGKPLAGAKVELNHRHSGGSVFGGSGEKTRTTDEDGGFVVRNVAPGEVSLKASAAGLADSKEETLTIVAAEERTGVSLTMRVGARLTGEIHPSVGKVANRQVTANGEGWHNTQSDSAGKFEFEGLNPGEYTVSFEPDMSDMDEGDDNYWMIQNARQQEERVELAEGGTAHVILGTPPESPITITGRVTAGGEGVAERMVTIKKDGGGGGRNDAVATTDSNGTYTATVDGPGKYHFAVGQGWGRSLSFTEEVPDKETVTIDFELPTGSLAGVVFGEDGDPVEGLVVQLELTEADGEDDDEGRMGQRQVQTDDEGRYEFDNLRAGKYLVRTGGANYWTYNRSTNKEFGRVMLADVRVEGGKATTGIDFHLRLGGTVKGTILDSGGNPVGGVWVQASDKNGVSFNVWGSRSDALGRFEVRGLPAGKAVLRASNEGGKGEATAEVFEEGTTEVEIVLE